MFLYVIPFVLMYAPRALSCVMVPVTSNEAFTISSFFSTVGGATAGAGVGVVVDVDVGAGAGASP